MGTRGRGYGEVGMGNTAAGQWDTAKGHGAPGLGHALLGHWGPRGRGSAGVGEGSLKGALHIRQVEGADGRTRDAAG